MRPWNYAEKLLILEVNRDGDVLEAEMLFGTTWDGVRGAALLSEMGKEEGEKCSLWEGCV